MRNATLIIVNSVLFLIANNGVSVSEEKNAMSYEHRYATIINQEISIQIKYSNPELNDLILNNKSENVEKLCAGKLLADRCASTFTNSLEEVLKGFHESKKQICPTCTVNPKNINQDYIFLEEEMGFELAKIHICSQSKGTQIQSAAKYLEETSIRNPHRTQGAIKYFKYSLPELNKGNVAIYEKYIHYNSLYVSSAVLMKLSENINELSLNIIETCITSSANSRVKKIAINILSGKGMQNSIFALDKVILNKNEDKDIIEAAKRAREAIEARNHN